MSSRQEEGGGRGGGGCGYSVAEFIPPCRLHSKSTVDLYSATLPTEPLSSLRDSLSGDGASGTPSLGEDQGHFRKQTAKKKNTPNQTKTSKQQQQQTETRKREKIKLMN